MLSQRGHEVIASTRHLADLAELEVACKVTLDVTDAVSIAAAVVEVGNVDVVINNAAMVVEGPVEAILVVMQSMFETNVFWPLRVSQAFLPGMRERQHGMIVNISSLAGQFAPPLQGVYEDSTGAAQRGVVVRDPAFGVRVVVVASGGIRTGILARQKHFSLEPYTPLVEQCEMRLAKYNAQERGASPEQVASTIADLIEQSAPPSRVLVGTQAEKLLARLSGKFMSRLVRTGLKW